ncbi:MAG: exo-alpha-sialidase [Phycisphaerales bacterium]|nr:MAG: exo-alpha-sialidase [Phycisphaerales bacterium]
MCVLIPLVVSALTLLSAPPAQAQLVDEDDLARIHREEPEPPDPAFQPATPLLPPTPPSVLLSGPFLTVQANVDENGRNIPGDAANEPSIAVNPLNSDQIVIGWRQFDTIQSNFRQAGRAYSHDGGLSWTFPGVFTPGVFRSDPVLDFDADGLFYYYSLQNNFCCDFFISDDGGVNWSDPFPARGGDKQWFGIDRTSGIGRGNIYASWTSSFGCNGARLLNFTRSTDGGRTFSNPITLPGQMQWGTYAIGPDGEVYVSSVSFNVSKSTNAQDPNQAPVFNVVGSFTLGGQFVSGTGPNPGGLVGQMWIDVDESDGPTRGHLYVLAPVDPPGIDPLDIMIARSRNGGVTWDAPVRVNDDPPVANAWNWFGTMSVAPSGRIDAVWNDTRTSLNTRISETFYSWSSDGGQTWSPSVMAGPAFDSYAGWPRQNKLGDYYDMESDELGAHLAYAATYNAEQDVYYMRIAVDCNDNRLHDGDDIASGRSLDTNGNRVPDECEGECKGTEAIGTAACKVKRGGATRLIAKLVGGLDGDTFNVELSSGERQNGTLNRKGKAKAKFADVPLGPGTAAASWGCGAEARRDYDCD